ncbi:MAG TPA: hypothetical protein VL134_09660 [Leptolyngbya sp.]|jgi:hypothetical protein|nr:hypothetical protein [Leptolyngbya sp.]
MISADLPDRSALDYRARLSPWCIVQLSPDLKHTTVQRFRKRSAAEEYLKAVRQLNRDRIYQIVFDLEAN